MRTQLLMTPVILAAVGCTLFEPDDETPAPMSEAELGAMSTMFTQALADGSRTSSSGSSGTTTAPATDGGASTQALGDIPLRVSLDFTQVSPVNRATACPSGGRVTTTGNVTVRCPDPPATGDCAVTGMLALRHGDVTNNLNDCMISSTLAIDGTLYMNFNGTSADVSLTLNGSLTVARKGPTNGLVPLDGCFVNLTSRSSTRRVTGTICGRSVNRPF